MVDIGEGFIETFAGWIATNALVGLIVCAMALTGAVVRERRLGSVVWERQRVA